MIITVHAKPASRVTSVEKVDDTTFVVSVCEPPVQGRANEAIVRALAQYFSVAASRVRIVQGHTARFKRVEVL